MKKSDARKRLAELEEYYSKSKKEIGYEFPELVYSPLQSSVIKLIKKTPKTKTEIAKSLDRPVTTIAPIIKRLEKDGVIKAGDKKKTINRFVSTFLAVNPALNIVNI